jgi:hypothetical protein
MTSTGTLVYDPKAATIESKPWWLIVQACPDLARYYRQSLNLFYRAQLKTQRPAWDSHISVVRGEEPPVRALWAKYQGEQVEFDYDPVLHTNGVYYWLAVTCFRLAEIRVELGLSPTPARPFHLTVALNPDGEWLDAEQAAAGSG